ncbi:MAG TPA: hypothetical protein VFA81_11835 [Burkholderiales bacterium]|nr:hypothetical protein [Burkholderiales bacterium]
MSQTTVVLDPCGDKSSKVHQLARRPRTLHDVQLGLLDNLKPNATHVLDRATTLLTERFELQSITRLSKRNPTAPASTEVYAELEKLDLVLLAVADCGGCTAWTVHDAVELERRGVPTVTFVSRMFLAMAESHAKLRGLDVLPVVKVPDPFGQFSAEEVADVIDSVLGELIRSATGAGDPSRVSAETAVSSPS